VLGRGIGVVACGELIELKLTAGDVAIPHCLLSGLQFDVVLLYQRLEVLEELWLASLKAVSFALTSSQA